MRKRLVVAFCLFVLASVAIAQKIDTKWNCTKPTTNPMLEVGDVPAHQYALAQGTCSATSSGSGEKSGAYTEFQEIWKASFTNHGHFNVTMDNGDMVYYNYSGLGSPDMKKPLSNKWKIESGTGKHKGIKGSGTCSGKQREDGGSDWVCTGATEMAGKPKA
jgi:hypothetical protein